MVKNDKDFIERVFFRFINDQFSNILGKANSKSKVVFIFFVIIFFVFVLNIFYFSDPILVWLVEDYERPSIVYGYDNNGEVVPYTEFYTQQRKIIELDRNFNQLNVVKTFIAAEDIRFNEHFGIDIPGIFRAMIINILSGKIKEGASTITQQSARLRFLNLERTIKRKLREFSLAILLEIKYPKHKILEIYFNEVPLGHGTLGIESASLFYFGKSYKDLSIGEASVLSSLTTSPNNYSPLKNPIKSISKMQTTFKRLVENGEISLQEAEKEYQHILKNYILTLNRYPDESSFTKRLNETPYAASYLLTLLPEEVKKNLETGGYKIYTTLNLKKQKIAEKVLEDWLKKLNEKHTLYKKSFTNYELFDEHFGEYFPLLKYLFGISDFKYSLSKEKRDFQLKYLREHRDDLILLNYFLGEKNVVLSLENNYKNEIENPNSQKEFIEGALVSINPLNGKIEAIVGGSKFLPSNQLLRFLSKRQPGSSLKPFIYSAGMDYFAKHPLETERSLTAATVFEDSPITFIEKDLSEYEPENFGGSYLGPIRLRDALVLSRNVVAIHAYTKIGPKIINSYLESVLNLPKDTLPREVSIALGSYEVSPLQLATAYTVFPRNGSLIKPFFIEKIIDKNGTIIYNAPAPEIREVFSPETVFIIKDMLKEVITKGTGRAAFIPGVPIYGKTGTSNNFTNAWFSGFTPNNVTVVYIGYDLNKSLGTSGTGGSYAAPVWREYIYNVLKDMNFPKYQEETIPENVVIKNICKSSGFLSSDNCEVIPEYFVKGTEPTTICTLHKSNNEKIKKNYKPDLKFKIEEEL
ncbi:MAG: penicillin-binding protein 1A [Leptonema sp. (in: bacteria)]